MLEQVGTETDMIKTVTYQAARASEDYRGCMRIGQTFSSFVGRRLGELGKDDRAQIS